jgi:hypothetical protein
MLMFFSAFMAVSAANPQAAKQAEADAVVCVRPSDSDTHSVGTRVRPKKVCKRKSEWGVVNSGTRSDQNQVKPVNAPVAGDGRQ